MKSLFGLIALTSSSGTKYVLHEHENFFLSIWLICNTTRDNAMLEPPYTFGGFIIGPLLDLRYTMETLSALEQVFQVMKYLTMHVFVSLRTPVLLS